MSEQLLAPVMPGLVPGIHALLSRKTRTWMAGTEPGHDGGRRPGIGERKRWPFLKQASGSDAVLRTAMPGDDGCRWPGISEQV